METRKKVIIGVVTVAVIAIGYLIVDHIRFVETDDAQIDAPTVLLAPKVSGYIMKVNVTEGQTVKAGEVLVEIDERDYANSLKQSSSELASLEARRHDAEKNFKRISELFQKEAVSTQQYDQASAAYSDLKAKYDAVTAQVAQAQLNFDNTKIRAPSDGFIARKSAEVGQLAAPGVPLLGFVSAISRWVTANFKETDLENVRVGAKVDIDVDAISKGIFHGEVESISAATGAVFTLLPPDNSTGNFTKVVQRVPVRIKFVELGADDIIRLRAGLSAVIKVHKH